MEIKQEELERLEKIVGHMAEFHWQQVEWLRRINRAQVAFEKWEANFQQWLRDNAPKG